MERHRGEVVDDGPGGQHGDGADRGAGHPPALVIVTLDPVGKNSWTLRKYLQEILPEHGHAVEEGEGEQQAGVHVQQQEGLLGHVTLGVQLRGGHLQRSQREIFLVQTKYFLVQSKYFYLQRHVDDVPLGGDDHLHHHHEEQGQELIDLAQNPGFRLGLTRIHHWKWSKNYSLTFFAGKMFAQ